MVTDIQGKLRSSNRSHDPRVPQNIPGVPLIRMSYAGANSGSPLSRHVRCSFGERLSLMCSSCIFAGLSQHECLEIASCSLMRTFARSQLLYAQGQPVQSLFLLHSGSVKETQVSRNGNEALLRVSARGDVVNVQADSAVRGNTCSARATESCKALVWEYRRIEWFSEKYPRLRRNITEILVGQLEELKERFREVATEKVTARLALLLARLANHVGTPCKEGIRISLNREELAQMTGTTVFTISRLLSAWSCEGFLETRREAVIVTDRKRLESAIEFKMPERRRTVPNPSNTEAESDAVDSESVTLV